MTPKARTPEYNLAANAISYREGLQSKFELFYRENLSEGLKQLDNLLLGATRGEMNHCRMSYSPFLALAYLHNDFVHTDYDHFTLETDGENSSTPSFIKQLNGARGEEGLLRKMVRALPSQSGLKKRTPIDFKLAVRTILPRAREKEDDFKFFPILSLVAMGVSETYPGNKKHNSARARIDLCRLGAQVLHTGLGFESGRVLPFWVYSDFIFGNSSAVEASTEKCRIDNQRFLEHVYTWLN